MHNVYFYETRDGYSPMKEYINELDKKMDSVNSVNRHKYELRQIISYIDMLALVGTESMPPYVRNIEGELWEYKPADNVVIFFAVINSEFILLHCFKKKIYDTPKSEIRKAQTEIVNWKLSGSRITWQDVKRNIASITQDELEEINITVDLIGNILKKRKQLGMSQKDLAEKIGVKAVMIARIESMRIFPQLDVIIKMLSSLNLRVNVIEK